MYSEKIRVVSDLNGMCRAMCCTNELIDVII